MENNLNKIPSSLENNKQLLFDDRYTPGLIRVRQITKLVAAKRNTKELRKVFIALKAPKRTQTWESENVNYSTDFRIPKIFKSQNSPKES